MFLSSEGIDIKKKTVGYCTNWSKLLRKKIKIDYLSQNLNILFL
jgi:hypothetical protein